MLEQPSHSVNKQIVELQDEAIVLLQRLISIPSFSREENITADAISDFLKSYDVPVERHLNNVWAVNKHFDLSKPTILLNSHHDTVKPNPGYTNDPFDPFVKDAKLYGLGSNDAGGCLVFLRPLRAHFGRRLRAVSRTLGSRLIRRHQHGT